MKGKIKVMEFTFVILNGLRLVEIFIFVLNNGLIEKEEECIT